MSFLSFCGMALTLLGYLVPYCTRGVAAYTNLEGPSPLLPPSALWKRYKQLFIPTVLDVLATCLQAAAVNYVGAGPASAMRGTLLVFVCGATRLVGEKKEWATAGEWRGILVSSLGATLVGLAEIYSGASGEPQAGSSGTSLNALQLTAAFGLTLSTLSNIAQGVQVAYETASVRGGLGGSESLGAFEVNGVEGVVGAVLIAGLMVVVPTSFEDSSATACALRTSPSIQTLSLVLPLLFLVSTNAYMLLSVSRGGNFRALLLVARSALVWIAELSLYYSGQVGYGQPWGKGGGLAAVGYGVLVLGGVLTWRAQNKREEEEARGEVAVEAAAAVAAAAEEGSLEGLGGGKTEGGESSPLSEESDTDTDSSISEKEDEEEKMVAVKSEPRK